MRSASIRISRVISGRSGQPTIWRLNKSLATVRNSQPSSGGDVRDVTRPHLVRLGHAKLSDQHQQVVLAVGGDLEATLTLGPDAMQLHQLLHSALAHPYSSGLQFFPAARPAVTADLDMH